MTFNKLLLALTVMSAIIAAQAATTSNFAGLYFGQTSDMIGAAILLASDAAGSFITGEELIVDGGYHAMTI